MTLREGHASGEHLDDGYQIANQHPFIDKKSPINHRQRTLASVESRNSIWYSQSREWSQSINCLIRNMVHSMRRLKHIHSYRIKVTQRNRKRKWKEMKLHINKLASNPRISFSEIGLCVDYQNGSRLPNEPKSKRNNVDSNGDTDAQQNIMSENGEWHIA